MRMFYDKQYEHILSHFVYRVKDKTPYKLWMESSHPISTYEYGGV